MNSFQRWLIALLVVLPFSVAFNLIRPEMEWWRHMTLWGLGMIAGAIFWIIWKPDET